MKHLLWLLIVASPAAAFESALEESVEIEPRGSATVSLLIRNDGILPARYSIEASAPDGFTAAAPSVVEVAPGGSVSVPVTLQAKASAVEGTGFLLVTVTQVGLPGAPDVSRTETMPVTMTATYGDQLVAPVANSWPWIFGVIGVGFAATAVVLFARQGVTLRAPLQVQVKAGTHTSVPVEVATRGARAQHLHLEADGIPQGWNVQVVPDEVDLRPGRATVVNVEVDVPPWAFQTAHVRLRAEGRKRATYVDVAPIS